MDDLMCVNQENDLDDVENPCEDLGMFGCRRADECDYQDGVCVWTEAPEDQKNLYMIVEWKDLTVDGEVVEETWCYSDGEDIEMITSMAQYKDVCKKFTDKA